MKKSLLMLAALMCMGLASKAQPSINDAFFDHVNYLGAFGTTDWTAGWCEWDPQNEAYPAATVTIPAGDITSNTTWTSGNVYLLDGWVYVKSGVTLTIEPGTIIRGDYVNKGSLIIERGAQLIAQGTEAHPIVFTSNEDPGNRDYGDWGGVILCGNAEINVDGDTAEIEGGVGSIYGGLNNTDNSGILTYIRIEFAGVPFVPDKEINGLTMGGVGSGTTIHHIQVSYSGDDAFEWFGGKVDCKYLVSFRTWDDDFDTDYGYQGHVQFAVALRDPDIADPGSKSNGFESDNDGNGSTNLPQTAAVFSNVSMFGPKVNSSTTISANYKNALHLRRNTALNVYNSFFAGYANGLLIDGALCESNATAGTLRMEFCYLSGITGDNFQTASGSTYDVASWFFGNMECNDTLAENTQLGIIDGWNLSTPNFLPDTWSPLLNRPWLDCAASVHENSNDINSVNVYPNPANEKVSVEFNLEKGKSVVIRLTDLTGRTLREFEEGNAITGLNQYTLSTLDLNEGLYLLTISTEASTTMQKLLVTR